MANSTIKTVKVYGITLLILCHPELLVSAFSFKAIKSAFIKPINIKHFIWSCSHKSLKRKENCLNHGYLTFKNVSHNKFLS